MVAKKLLFTCMLLCILDSLCFSQENTIKKSVKFIYIVDFYDKPPIITMMAVVDPSRRDTTFKLPSNQSSEICRLLNADGIIYTKLKPSTELLTLNEVLNLYKISLKFKKFRIKVDDMELNSPELLISSNVISHVKIEKVHQVDYIRIITKGYYEEKKEAEKRRKNGEEYIN